MEQADAGEWRVGDVIGYARIWLYAGWEEARFRIIAVHPLNRVDLLGIRSGAYGTWPLNEVVRDQYLAGWAIRYPEESSDDPDGIP